MDVGVGSAGDGGPFVNAATVWMSVLGGEMSSLSLWAQSQTSLVTLERWTWIKWALWIAVGFFGVFPGIVAYMVWAERKVAARFQDRIGPNRVGPLGLLQPIADAIKLLTKESIVPREADQWVHLLAPVIILVSAMLVLAVIPFGVEMAPVNVPSGIVYLMAVSSLSPLGIFLAGWASRNKYSLLGAMRSVAQLVSYEIPQVLSTIPVVLWTGSLSLVAIFDKQVEHGWFLLSPPGLLGFSILLIASIAEVNRTPFDLPEAESEIIAGYHTEYSGMRFGLFFLAEYMSVFGVCCLVTVLYLGGGLPLPISDFPVSILGTTTFSYMLVNLGLFAGFLVKVSLLIFVMFWVRATLPRMRVDRLMNFAWKYLVPLSIANVMIAAIWYELVLRPGKPFTAGFLGSLSGGLANWLVGWAVTGPLTLFLVLLVIAFNRRVGSADDEKPIVMHSRTPAAGVSSVR
ncbi:MAG: NADH-quinone oxidoreductase subunit NuoH [Isosphaeraceae bacterium]